MKFRLPAIAAALLCCLSCVETRYEVGSNLLPIEQRYKTYTLDIPIEELSVKMADSLSGYHQTRITIGAVKDEEFGLTTRGSAMTLVPMFSESLDLGKPGTRKAKRFHFAAEFDTTSFAASNQKHILQRVHVYPLNKAITKDDYDCNGKVEYGSFKGISGDIALGSPVANGSDSLSFNLSLDYAQYFLDNMTDEDFKDYNKFIAKFPGIYINTETPAVNDKGRINCYKLQIAYDSEYYYVTGNYATLTYSAEFKDADGKWAPKDTTIMFYYGADDFYDLDSLLTKGTAGSYPEYALNLTGYEDRTGKHSIDVSDKSTFTVEGGGGYKPVVSASYLRKSVMDEIKKNISENDLMIEDTSKVIVHKASIVLPFEFPEDYTLMNRYPAYMSPVCRIRTESKHVNYVNISDSSMSSENQGDIDRSNLWYSPDITYHMQEILLSKKDADLSNYDIWLLILANETVTTTSSGNSDLSEYYQYLAYQSYYSSMYGGYGGYGGYGSYGSSYYNNYYSYMLASMYAGGSTTTETTTALDKERYYRALFHGPKWSDKKSRPSFRIVYSLPVE